MYINLNEQEQAQLDKLCDKYEYASLLWHITIPTETDAVFRVYSQDVEEWRSVVREEGKFLPGMYGTLRAKVTKLFNKTNFPN